jgi:uncharacterized protein (DUF2336 family)
MTIPASANPDLTSLLALARDGQLDVRPVLLRVQTDLFLTAPSRPAEMLRAFESLATGLIPLVDIETAAIVARKLAPHLDTPRPVIDAFIARAAEIAEIVLALTPHFDRAILAEMASHGEVRFALAVASRSDLDADLLARLVARGEQSIDERILSHSSLVLTRPLADALIERARNRPDLAGQLVARPDLTGADKAPLFQHATEVERAMILRDIERLVALDGHSRLARPAGEAEIETLLAAAAKSDRTAFTTALAAMLGAEPAAGPRLFDDPYGIVLALALIAAGVGEEDAIRMFLRLDPSIARSVESVFGLADLMRRVRRPVAERVVRAILGQGERAPRREGTHVPGMAPAGVPARPASTVHQRDDWSTPAERKAAG